ncbi:Nucleolar protein Nop52 [Reticulomyxa filosa]|uniref:Nucleolar protein Nop52 n=1 Tax=Reticulomyxa filosa TaxID=46433 RepID=X6MY05_RETFI|nr:Nucleolar protein Nop52 [Reticulomyxa filosa]|eukprot:ETO18726.1 Nucleolar protein Nop52 [Reticulomyxa filosa]
MHLPPSSPTYKKKDYSIGADDSSTSDSEADTTDKDEEKSKSKKERQMSEESESQEAAESNRSSELPGQLMNDNEDHNDNNNNDNDNNDNNDNNNDNNNNNNNNNEIDDLANLPIINMNNINMNNNERPSVVRQVLRWLGSGQMIVIVALMAIGLKMSPSLLSYDDEWDDDKRREFHDIASSYLQEELWKDFEAKERTGENVLLDNIGAIPADHPTTQWLKHLRVGSFVDALDFQNQCC